ncbi:MAG: family ATPase, partial [Acidobacteriota bacterium]|nr:family ATPase [Acidobacteriota bacterium]
MSEKNGALANKKSHNIVILGLPRSGKSTLLASIFQAISTREDILMHLNLNDKNGMKYLNEIWMDALVKGRFPPGARLLKNADINISVESVPEKIKHDFTFLEVPENIDSSFIQNALIGEGKSRFLDAMHKADLAILVIEALAAHVNDLSVSLFFQALKKYDITLPVLLVISTWDKVRPEPENVNDFVKSRMPILCKWLKYRNFPKTEIFKFSVGEIDYVKDQYGKLLGINKLKWNTSDSNVIFEWIWDYFNKPENNGKKRTGLEQELKSKLSRLSLEPENIDLLREIKDYYLILDEKQKSDEVGRQLKGLIEKKEYEYNLGKRIILQQMELHDLDFFGNFKWAFQPGVNVLLGRNGYGKSHLLRLLATLLQKNEDISPEYFKYSKTEPFTKLVVEREDKPETIYRNRLVFEEGIGRVPLLAIPDMRSLDRSKTSVSVGISEYDRDRDLSQQWASHFLYQRPIDGLIQDFLYQLCITYL